MTTSRMTHSRWTTTSRWTQRCKRTAWSGALGLVVLAACASGSARAEDDDNEKSIWNLDQRLWNGIMNSLGLKSINDGSIEYRERSPLVVPPQRNLPPPETAAAKSPAWPVDPDVKRREDAAAKRKTARARIADLEHQGRNLTPSELNPTGSTRSSTGGSGRPEPNPEESNLQPSQLGYIGGLFSWAGFGFGLGPQNEVGTFKTEPPRTDLTAPPVGYQTPSPAQPYGVTKRIEYGKAEKIEDHGTLGR